MHCGNCGKLMIANAIFCNNCGAKAQHAQAQMPTEHIQNSDDITNSVSAEKTLVKNSKPANYALAVFFGFLIFVFCILFLAILNIRGTLSEGAIESMMARIDIPNIRVGRMLNLEGRAYDRNITLSEWIYDEIPTANIQQHNITLRSIESLLDALPINEFAATILTRYADGLLTGDVNIRIFNREIENFVRNNEWIFSRELGVEITEEDYILLNNELNTLDLQHISHLGGILNDIDVNPSLIRWGLSIPLLIVLVLLVILTLVGIFFVCGFKLRKTCVSLGIVLMCVGVVFGFFRIMLNTLVSNIVPVNVDGALVNAFLAGIQNSIMLTGLASLIIGIIPIAIVIGVTRIAKK